MSLKLIAGDFTDTHQVKVYKDIESGEYIVKLFNKTSGKLVHYEPADYFAMDRQDAIVSSQHMLRHATIWHDGSQNEVM